MVFSPEPHPILSGVLGLLSLPRFLLLICMLPVIPGCAPLGGVAMLTSGVGSATASGIERSFDGASIKTFSNTAANVAAASEATLRKMGFDIDTTTPGDDGITLRAHSARRDVKIKIIPIARRAARLRIDVDSGWIFSEDPATATEIMLQTSRRLPAPD
tara:strand:+ start:4953 stop:5429 length:477 start_codon:yes stop_codon:yes gene_type:complete